MNWYLSFGQSQTDTQKINPNWDRPVQLWLGHALPNEDFISTKSDMSLKDKCWRLRQRFAFSYGELTIASYCLFNCLRKELV
jgi:hypothetical protein